jgi:hypothetical protein
MQPARKVTIFRIGRGWWALIFAANAAVFVSYRERK